MGSTAVHLAVLGALFVVRQSAPVLVPGPDVVQVSLADLPAATPPVPTPPAPRPEIQQPEVKPTDQTGVKLAKPKPKPKEKPAETKPAEETPPVPALPYAAVGPAGLKGSVAVDARDFEFTYYLVLVRNKIASSWTPPGGLAGAQGARAVVNFRIARDGSIRDPRLESGSGFDLFDRSALRAVLVSDPLPPLPLGFGGGDLGVHFGFEYANP